MRQFRACWSCGGLAAIFLVAQILFILYWHQREAKQTWHAVQISHRSSSREKVRFTDKPASLLEIQMQRKQKLLAACADPNFTFPGKNWDYDEIPKREFGSFIAIDNVKLVYCAVPKVACSNWKRVLAIVSNSTVYKDLAHLPPGIEHGLFDKWKSDKDLKTFVQLRLDTHKTFIFVRHPFVRLISLFRNKFESPNSYVFHHVARMLRLYGNVSNIPENSKKLFEMGIKPTFTHFIQYLLDPKNEKGFFNIHWRQVYQICHPCQIDYDFIGKIETMDKDITYLMNLLNLKVAFQFPSKYQSATTNNLLRKYFGDVPINLIEKLYKLYEPDFVLFGYSRPQFLYDEAK
uniref:Carbohydrate sulfotransferase n=1 Tax=Callorhinchus milii TaxID=7868 RepID=V9KZL4_CALMI